MNPYFGETLHIKMVWNQMQGYCVIHRGPRVARNGWGENFNHWANSRWKKIYVRKKTFYVEGFTKTMDDSAGRHICIDNSFVSWISHILLLQFENYHIILTFGEQHIFLTSRLSGWFNTIWNGDTSWFVGFSHPFDIDLWRFLDLMNYREFPHKP